MPRAYAGVSIDGRRISVRVCGATSGTVINQVTRPTPQNYTPAVALLARLIEMARQGHDIRTLTVAIAGIVEQAESARQPWGGRALICGQSSKKPRRSRR